MGKIKNYIDKSYNFESFSSRVAMINECFPNCFFNNEDKKQLWRAINDIEAFFCNSCKNLGVYWPKNVARLDPNNYVGRCSCLVGSFFYTNVQKIDEMK